ncbi:MAG: sugar phosphate isomerase/epimerase family protein [Planctomycetales bacterium]
MPCVLDRRDFLKSAAALTAGVAAGWPLGAAAADGEFPKLRKAVKYGMIKTDGSIAEKFELIQRLGFAGVELDSPSQIDREEARRASEETGIKIHGVIDSVHWQVRLSDPDPQVRSRAVEALRTALVDAQFYGASTVLLVPGKVADPVKENYDQVYARSQEEIRKVLPLAKEVGVQIAIEVVWNDFITKPQQLAKYVDDFESPAVGAYFDVSNMVKYGVPSAEWIRQLGRRMLKFDFKGYSRKNNWVPIGEGDEDWPEVLKALAEIRYDGWATSEVAGGGEKELRVIADQMNRVLGLSS